MPRYKALTESEAGTKARHLWGDLGFAEQVKIDSVLIEQQIEFWVGVLSPFTKNPIIFGNSLRSFEEAFERALNNPRTKSLLERLSEALRDQERERAK